MPLFAAVPPLLRRMRGDLLRHAALSPTMAAAMWGGYLAFGGLDVLALRCPPVGRASRWTDVAGGAVAGAGVVAGVASMSTFQRPGQLQGTATGDLITRGPYTMSRNPQYAAMVANLAGAALRRRSPSGAFLAAGMAVTLNAWVKAEERHLEQHFGESYNRYRDEVNRWVGRPGATSTSDGGS